MEDSNPNDDKTSPAYRRALRGQTRITVFVVLAVLAMFALPLLINLARKYL